MVTVLVRGDIPAWSGVRSTGQSQFSIKKSPSRGSVRVRSTGQCQYSQKIPTAWVRGSVRVRSTGQCQFSQKNPHLVGQLGSEVWVSAIFSQKISTSWVG